MPQIIREVSIDVSKSNIFQAIVAKQNDSNSRFLRATITDNSKKITVESSSIVTINGTRPDEEAKAFEGSVNEDGTVTVPLTNWLLELDGRVKCDISIVDAEGRKLTTMKFTLLVEAASYDGSDISEDEDADLLISILAECAAAKEAVDLLEEKLDVQVAKMTNVATMAPLDIEYEIVEGIKYYKGFIEDENAFTVFIKIPDKKFACIYATKTNIKGGYNDSYLCIGSICDANKEAIENFGSNDDSSRTVFNYDAFIAKNLENAAYFTISYAKGTEFEIKMNGIDAVNESYFPIANTDLPDDFIVKGDNLVTHLVDIYYNNNVGRWVYDPTYSRTNFFEVAIGDSFYHNSSKIYLQLFDENYTFLEAVGPINSSFVIEAEGVKYACAFSTVEGNIATDFWLSRVDMSRKGCTSPKVINPKYIDISGKTKKALKSWYNGKVASFMGDSITASALGGYYITYLNNYFDFASLARSAIGGTWVSGEGNTLGAAFWQDDRINAVDINSDVIFIMGGTNDANNNVELGDNDISNCDTSTFYGAYNVLISKLLYKFHKLESGYYADIDYSGVTQVETAKTIQIFLITPPYMLGSETAYEKTPAFADAVVNIGKLLGLPVCDIRANSGVNLFLAECYHGTENDKVDYVHLNSIAHKQWAKVIIGKMLEVEPLE